MAHLVDPTKCAYKFIRHKKTEANASVYAPQVGLEPTTTRLTAECSAIELLRNIGIRQRPTLPGRVQPSTIGTERLNFCVRYGNRWNPLVIATGNGELVLSRTLTTAHRMILRQTVFQLISFSLEGFACASRSGFPFRSSLSSAFPDLR